MTPERWQQVMEVFDAVMALDPTQRSSHLEKACAADPELRHEVDTLLFSHQQAGTEFLNAPAANFSTGGAHPSISVARVGHRIGAYQVVAEIGHGGMGEVYRAVRADGQYEKQVAIKMVLVGYDSSYVLERFRTERQILASLDHPNIARLLDGGTTEQGVPYLVMELIDGIPIDKYCDAHQLTISERLQLFRQVCGAVQYAHQHLVIHRDIKPGNILVTQEGAPKLLDFGIAKIVSPTIEAGTTLGRAMTPEYASPEQIRNEPITTATDVYSLGVVLYELLTGRYPYQADTNTPHELARAICEEAPARPSTAILRHDSGKTETPEQVSSKREGSPARLRRRLAGDLDNIVLRALHKEPQRRYTSAERFADDLRRHLEGLPVTARQDSWSYRAGKFARRHRVGVAATALVLLALLGGIAATVHEARIAQRRFNDVRQLANSFLFEFHDAIKDLPGSTPARVMVVRRALEYLGRLSQEAAGDPVLQQELATAYEKVADVQGSPLYPNLGDKAGALENYRKSMRIRDTLLVGDPANVQNRRSLATLYQKIGDTLAKSGNAAEGLEAHRKGLVIIDSLLASDPANPQMLRALSISADRIGGILRDNGDLPGALEHYEMGLKVLEDMQAKGLLEPSEQRGLLIASTHVGNTLNATGDTAGALKSYRQAVEVAERLAAADPTNAQAKRDLSIVYGKVGQLLVQKGSIPEGMEVYLKGQKISEELALADPKDVQIQGDVATGHKEIGEMLVQMNQVPAAMVHFRKALATARELSSVDTKDEDLRGFLAECYFNMGKAYVMLASAPKVRPAQQVDYWGKARPFLQQSLDVWLDMKRRGTLMGSQAQEPEDAAQQLARCDNALRALERTSSR